VPALSGIEPIIKLSAKSREIVYALMNRCMVDDYQEKVSDF
jgi:hypothetical protein